jgi:hypothetical protein
MLEVLRDLYGVTEVKNEIQRMHGELIKILKEKNINYTDLRSALVPSTDKEEAVFIFDSSVTNSGLYGREIFNQILPLLERRYVYIFRVQPVVFVSHDKCFTFLE